MIVGKNSEIIMQKNLQVDSWKTEYLENKTSGEYELTENYEGKINISQTDSYKYLGFLISCTGDNMVNIREMKKKSFGIIRRILNKLTSLSLNQYYFECAMILLKVILRPTILYAADMYYSMKENEYRQLERIEEEYLRKIVRTTKGCPLSNLYLEFGYLPARFEIIKMRLLYFKYILEQPEKSNIRKMLNLQFEKPSSGDWASTCMSDLQYINLEISIEEIREISKRKYLDILKEKISAKALSYLIEKRGKKGSEIVYSCIEMSEYLQPYNDELTIEQKREMFAVRNRMINIPANFSSECETKCICGKKEEMAHIYKCLILSENKEPTTKYEKIYNGNLKEQLLVYRKFMKSMEIRDSNQRKEQCLPCGHSDPLCCTVREQ